MWKEQEPHKTGQHLSARMSENPSNKSWKTFKKPLQAVIPATGAATNYEKSPDIFWGRWLCLKPEGIRSFVFHLLKCSGQAWPHARYVDTKAKFQCCQHLFKDAILIFLTRLPEHVVNISLRCGWWSKVTPLSASRSWIMEFGTNMQMWALAWLCLCTVNDSHVSIMYEMRTGGEKVQAAP